MSLKKPRIEKMKLKPVAPPPPKEFENSPTILISGRKKLCAENAGEKIVNGSYTHQHKVFLANCIGVCMSPAEIKEAFNLEFGFPLPSSSTICRLIKNSPRWSPMIKKIQTQYLSKMSEIAGSHKHVRLERAEKVYDRAVEKGDLKHQLLSIEQQRKEFDKHENNSILILQQQYNFMSDDELAQRKQFLLGKLGNLREVQIGASSVQGEVGGSGQNPG